MDVEGLACGERRGYAAGTAGDRPGRSFHPFEPHGMAMHGTTTPTRIGRGDLMLAYPHQRVLFPTLQLQYVLRAQGLAEGQAKTIVGRDAGEPDLPPLEILHRIQGQSVQQYTHCGAPFAGLCRSSLL